MTFLDTDHLTLLKYPENPRYATLVARMEASADQEIGTTIVSVEEQWRGWLAVIARFRNVDRQVAPYRELMGLLDALQRWTVLPFDEAAAAQFTRLRGEGVVEVLRHVQSEGCDRRGKVWASGTAIRAAGRKGSCGKR